MRLLHTTTYKLTTFFDSLIPPYVILSHTWGAEEVSFQDIASLESASLLSGFRKIRLACAQAAKDGFQWCWIDTCCIDKTSSAELSEAINSMFKWYQKSIICYAFIEDVNLRHERWDFEFANSRWWTRGWTLQELIAPRTVEFYDKSWKEIGTKRSLQKEVASISGINSATLGGESLRDRCVAELMSWAAKRKTTREEDMAYCLMGLFGVNMSMLYGEGGAGAFRRLQEEILKTSNDYSLFAWRSAHLSVMPQRVLASSPAPFHGRTDGENVYSNLRFHDDFPRQEFRSYQNQMNSAPMFTSMGLDITLALRKDSQSRCLAYLNCARVTDGYILCIALGNQRQDSFKYKRVNADQLVFVPPESFKMFALTRMYASVNMSQSDLANPQAQELRSLNYHICMDPDSLSEIYIKGLRSIDKWDPDEQPSEQVLTGASVWMGSLTLSGVFECWRYEEPLFRVAFGVQGPESEPWCLIFSPVESNYGFCTLSEDYSRYRLLLENECDGLSDRSDIKIEPGKRAHVSIKKSTITTLGSNRFPGRREFQMLFRIVVSLKRNQVGFEEARWLLS